MLVDADLAGLELTRTRAGAVRAFARAVADDTVRLDRSPSLDGLVAAICAVDGLGHWTAHYLALRLGEPDACPITDLALQRVIPQPPGQPAATLGLITERWRPWRALATTHLWAADTGEADRLAHLDELRGAA
jgi:AraC family transcriptional regulator of adaptative response / DNA-3-methyladenine glycosylase II